MGGEAENIIVVLVLVSGAVAADAWYCVLASTWFSGCSDGVLD